ncbi:ankyrin repeat-containing domain protein [Aspergillus coremiiformis]|uniref:Ankyrin repeat-containing domain protein n=1 Tax=Aspergillus coremiiformis TaxID=138285 RepID=A0A5N6Z9T2_9EURO|nr:ankyrin repeat-containing domain protein [Aspergillus coremiiformis]
MCPTQVPGAVSPHDQSSQMDRTVPSARIRAESDSSSQGFPGDPVVGCRDTIPWQSINIDELKKNNFGIIDTLEEYENQSNEKRLACQNIFYPIESLIRNGEVDHIKELIEHGLNVHGYAPGETFLGVAVRLGKGKVAEYLLDHYQFTFDELEVHKPSLADLAVICGNRQTFTRLMALYSGRSALGRLAGNLSDNAIVRICGEYETDTVMQLLESRLRLDVKDTLTDDTPVHVAAMRSDCDVLQWILNKGARVDSQRVFARNRENKTALQLALSSGADENTNILMDWVVIATRDQVDYNGWETLITAQEHKNPEVVRKLFELGCEKDYEERGEREERTELLNYLQRHPHEIGPIKQIADMLIDEDKAPSGRPLSKRRI